MTPEQNEEQKLKQWIESHPGFIAKLLGSLKKGVIEKVSQKKSDSSRINAQKAREARKIKASLSSQAIDPLHSPQESIRSTNTSSQKP